ARFGQQVVLQGHDPKTDYMSTTDSNSEHITVDSSSSPPLRPGVYFIAVANFGPGDATYNLTATVAGGVVSHVPALFGVEGHLEGDVLTLRLSAFDLDMDIASIAVQLLDSSGNAIGSPHTFEVQSQSQRMETELSVNGLSMLPAAVQAGVTVIDRSGNSSA